jgi:hypothetical protein
MIQKSPQDCREAEGGVQAKVDRALPEKQPTAAIVMRATRRVEIVVIS